MNGGGGQPRRRFVRDGEVPVVVLHPRSESDTRHATALSDITRQRDLERAARIRAEQALQDAQATIQGLQTRLAHAELEREERAAQLIEAPTTGATPDEPSASLPDFEPAKVEDEPTPVKWWRDPGEPDRPSRTKR